MASAVRLGPALRELRLHLCQKGQASKGAREFVEKHYVNLKSANPKFPILIRECSGVEPRLWARYEYGKEEAFSLRDLTSDEVLGKIAAVNK